MRERECTAIGTFSTDWTMSFSERAEWFPPGWFALVCLVDDTLLASCLALLILPQCPSLQSPELSCPSVVVLPSSSFLHLSSSFFLLPMSPMLPMLTMKLPLLCFLCLPRLDPFMWPFGFIWPMRPTRLMPLQHVLITPTPTVAASLTD